MDAGHTDTLAQHRSSSFSDSIVSQPRRSFNLRVHKETHIPNEKQSDGKISRLVEIRKYVHFFGSGILAGIFLVKD